MMQIQGLMVSTSTKSLNLDTLQMKRRRVPINFKLDFQLDFLPGLMVCACTSLTWTHIMVEQRLLCYFILTGFTTLHDFPHRERQEAIRGYLYPLSPQFLMQGELVEALKSVLCQYEWIEVGDESVYSTHRTDMCRTLHTHSKFAKRTVWDSCQCLLT